MFKYGLYNVDIRSNPKEKKMTNYIGYGFRGVRNDGRVFSGVVQDMRIVKDRTLVVIRQEDNAHKSFYIEDMTGGHSFSLVNGQAFLVK
jgi:hypothetical protein